MKDIKGNLIREGIITKPFDYEGLDEDWIITYKYFEEKFISYYRSYADAFRLSNCVFYIRQDYRNCNAFAQIKEHYNIIGITNAYPALMKDKFDDKYFSSIICICFINQTSISEAYINLHEDHNFKFNEFMLNCSIHYVFSHEFQHILQSNSSKISKNISFSENLDKSNFSVEQHVREFDADRMASFEVLKYAFSVYRSLKNKDNEKQKIILYIALASIVITINLFYFGVTDPTDLECTIYKQDFYTKKYSHPHPLVRIYNIVEFFYESVQDDFPQLRIDFQETLNNILGISKIYFDNLIPSQNAMKIFFEDSIKFTDEINSYNQELYDFAINNEPVISLFNMRGISFQA